MTAQPEDNETPDMTPEEAAEFEKAFLDWVLIGECKAEIHELKNLKPTTITERMQANQELEKLEAKLAERLEHVTDLAGHKAKSEPEPAPAALPEAVVMPSPAPHKRQRGDLLTSTIDKAIRACDGMTDKHDVFNVLRQWATEKPPRPPLIGVTEKGIQWLDAKDETKELTLDALAKRLKLPAKRG